MQIIVRNVHKIFTKSQYFLVKKKLTSSPTNFIRFISICQRMDSFIIKDFSKHADKHVSL